MGDMVIRMSDVDEAYAIIARQRVRSVSSGEMPTVDDYRHALIQCVVDKAHDWRVACESAEAASKEIGQLKAEIAQLRLTDDERAAVIWAAAIEPEPNGRWTAKEEKAWNHRSATLRGLLERLGGGPSDERPTRNRTRTGRE